MRRQGARSAPEGRAFLHIRWASIINLSSLRYLPTDSDGFASGREERHPLRRVSAFFPRGEFVAVCRRNPKAGSCGFCTMFYRFGRNAAERMYRKLRSRHLVQAFASRHPLRRDVSTTMIYNPKDRSIPFGLSFEGEAGDIVSQSLQDG